MMPCRNIITIVLTTLSLLTHISSARDTITPTSSLAFNETLISANGEFALGFFTPPNSTNSYVGLWYNKIPETPPTIVWVANRDKPATNSTSTLSLTLTGNLTIPGIWSTTIPSSLSQPVARLLNSGNLVIIDSSGRYAWQGFDHPTDTLISGMKLGVNFRSDGVINRTLLAWSSYNDPSSGRYYAYMDVLGDPDIYFCQRPGRRIWRTGAWDGLQLSGIPEMNTITDFNFFVNNATEVTFSYEINNQSFMSRVVTNSTGYMQRALWVWGTGQWNYFWFVPKDLCDNIGSCGPYGLCDVNNSPLCECLVRQGFTPKNPLNWNYYREGQQGCVRETKLDCVNGTDGFVTVSNVKLPQSENAVVDMSFSLDECEALCKKNCSCTAYASADIVGSGSGCVIWVGELYDVRTYVGKGQNLYVRLAAKDLDIASSTSSRPALSSQATETILRHRPAVSSSLPSGYQA